MALQMNFYQFSATLTNFLIFDSLGGNPCHVILVCVFSLNET